VILTFLDLETTGLSEKDDILEIAAIFTDENLNIVGEYQRILHYNKNKPISSIISEMHGNNGLLEECTKSLLDYGDIEAELLSVMVKLFPKWKTTLCGVNVGFDQRFLKTWLPAVDLYIGYSTIDILAIRRACWLYNRGVAMNAPKPLAKQHRALEDTRNAIVELKYFKERFFQVCVT